MALSTIQSNNKLIKWQTDFRVEWGRENLFSRYQGSEMTSIIQTVNDLKSGGEEIRIPILAKAAGVGVGSGTLVGNEEALDDYGMSMKIDWARNAFTMKKSERHKDAADAFGQVKPLLSLWADELRRDETIEAMMALPSESAQVNLGSALGDRVCGIRYGAATAAQRNTFNSDNSDRVLFGNAVANYNGTHATALANIDATNDLFTYSSLKLLKYVAKKASPKIKPFKVESGKEYFVCFAGSRVFKDLQTSLDTIDMNGRSREGKGMDGNPLFQDGDEQYRGVIAVEIPEIDNLCDDNWTSLLTAGANSNQVNPVFLCGQSALAMAVGQMPKPVFRKEDDYGFIDSAGIEMAYGISKIFKKHPKASTPLKQWGMVTGFFANTP